MFTIQRNNLNKLTNAKRLLNRNINVILEKIKLRLFIKIGTPCSIFNDMETHIKHKKRICSAQIYHFIYTKLVEIYKELKNGKYDNKKFNYIILSMSRK